ncbi:unnamed protein product [Rotaria sp. Silwood1]|nr:unnamed protein product [Rotaria sp. Silwood1]CAF5013126.1 unnamed protein product [Rotaria sp. Silwood1]
MSRKYEKLRKQILILHELHQNWSSSDIANELMNSDCPPSQTRQTLIRYVNYTIKRGTIEARKRTGRPRTTRTSIFISLVKDHMENNLGQSIRKTNDLLQKNHVNSSYSSVRRTLKEDIKLQPWKLTRSQKISPIQREARVISAKKLLKKFGLNPTRSNSKWKRLVNTDFSGRVSLLQKHNSKNSIIWSTSKTTIPLALQSVHQEKCSPGVLLYGAISSRGLIPPTAPVFIDDWLNIECQKINKKKPTMDRFLYVKLVKQLKIHIDQLYDDVNVIWQDDGDSKHRSHYALAKINEIFDNRINPEEQSDKMADTDYSEIEKGTAPYKGMEFT